MLIQLTYMSSATGHIEPGMLTEILSASRENNRRAAITGMLVVKGDKFLQALEGEADKVHDLFNKISKDKRHNGIVKIGEKTINERAFASWDMAFKNLDDDTSAYRKMFKDVDFNDPGLVKDAGRINSIFRTLVEKS